MLFSSFEFLLVFLPLAFALYYIVGRFMPRSVAFGVLALSSLAFYGYWEWRYLFLLVPSIALNYALGRLIAGRRSRDLRARRYLFTGIAINIGLIGVFKYADFILSSCSAVTGVELSPLGLALPLGISFFTFQQVAYLIDCNQDATSERSPVSYTLFVMFFAQLIAGPIVHHKTMLPQFRARGANRLNPTHIALGLMWLSFGLFKKVVIADSLSPWVSQAFDGTGTIGFAGAWAGALAWTFQLYFDFSGYSDMAIGLGLLFNIRLPENFNSPYRATNIVDFWRRWHMTLSAFLRDYIYIPLGGNRLGPSRRYVNLMLTMLIGGLWHGAAWTYVAWGGLHGLYLCVNHLWSRMGFKLPRAISWGLTMLAVITAWVLFRSVPADGQGGFTRAYEMLAAMLGLSEGGVRFSASPLQWAVLAVLGIFCLAVPNTTRHLTSKKRGIPTAVLAALAFIIAMLVLRETLTDTGRVTEFIYFQF